MNTYAEATKALNVELQRAQVYGPSAINPSKQVLNHMDILLVERDHDLGKRASTQHERFAMLVRMGHYF